MSELIAPPNMKEDRRQGCLTFTAAALFMVVLLVNYIGVFKRLREAAREYGTDLPTYFSENGGKVLDGVKITLPGAFNPVDLLRFSTVSFVLVLLTGVVVVWVWRAAGAFEPGRPPLVIWLSGVLLPPLVGLAWIPVDFLFIVGPFMGMTNPEGFGAVVVGEALWSVTWGLELSAVLSLIFLVARVSARRSRGLEQGAG